MENTNLDKWEEVKDTGCFWSPEKEGDEVEGVITSMSEDNYGLRVTLKTKENEIVLPSHAVLQNRIKSCKVGDVVKVIFEKKELPKIKGRNPTNIYKVLKKVL